VLGERAVDMLDTGFHWLSRHERVVTVSVLSAVGVFLVAHGVVLLST
jgi:hypothetical protein